MTNLHRHPHRHRRARTRDVLHRRVRALTALVGLTSLTGAGALTIELAQPSAAAVHPKAPAATPASSPAQAPASAPAAAPHAARVHHPRKVVHHTAPAPAPAQSTASTSTSGGS